MARRAPASRIILGIPELDRRLEGMKLAVANKIARGALSKGARLAAKKIKSQVPSAQKSVRKAIGSSVKKQKSGPNKGWTLAKAGGGVGQSAAKQKAAAADAKESRKGNGGVGITAANIHWYILGTKQRIVRATGQNAGKMPAHPIVQKAMATGKGAVIQAIREGVADGIDRERARLVRLHNVR